MRSCLIILVAVAGLAACSQQPTTAGAPATQAATPAQTLMHDLPVARWTARDGSVAGETVTLQRAGTLFVQSNSQTPVKANDLYHAQVTIDAKAAADVLLRLSNGCGSAGQEIATVEYHLQPGPNTLSAAHQFTRPADCARLTIVASDPVAFTMQGNRMATGG